MITRYLVLASVIAPLWASAQQGGVADTIIVTATRTAMPLAEAIVPVTVIGRDQIELSLATDLAELLRFEAGLDIGRNGGPGQATSVFMRGMESNHTLVLVDGVRVNPGTLGGAAIQHIAPEIIERVEIVKGSRSSLYGTDAIGGVINIITRRATAPFLEAAAGAGSFDHRTGYLSVGEKADWGEVGATVNWQDSAGYAVRTDSDTRRGYDNVNASLYGRREFGIGDLTLRHWRAEGTVEYLDFFLSPLDQDYLNQSTALELDTAIGERAASKLILSYTNDDIRQNQSDDFVESERFALDWQYSFDVAAHALAAGVFVAEERANTLSFGNGFDEDTEYRAVFLHDSMAFGRHRIFVAARYSDYDSFGSELTWNAEYAFELSDRWTLSAGLGHGFRAPDATDRYGFGGNVNLEPEASDDVQLGVEYRPTDRQLVRLELYRNDIEDLIEFDFVGFVLRNIAEAEIRGAQLGYEYSGDRFLFKADFVTQRAVDAADDSRLPRRAEESLTVNVVRRLGPHQVGVSMLASGDREDFATTLPSYVLVNLTGQLALGERWQLNARIENVFDEDYETAAGFRMQELSAFAELSYRSR